MAIHVTCYAAPLVDGLAYVAPGSTLAALRGAGSLLAAAPKPVQLVICTPEPDGEAQVNARAARALFRSAAVAALTATENAVGPAVGRRARAVERTVAGFGWLLLLTGGSIATGLAGLWVAFGFPLLRRTTLERADSRRAAAALADSMETARIAARTHSGLAQLAQLLASGAGAGPPTARYRRAAAACAALGLAPLTDFYAALSRGAAPSMVWAEMASGEA